MRLLVTRPEPNGERTAVALRARGHEALVAPLMRVEAIADADLGTGPWSALAFTSATAVRALAQHQRRTELTGLSAFAVGARTAEAARAAGFSVVAVGGGDAAELARLIAAQVADSDGTLLHLAGEDRAGDLAGGLPPALKARTVVIYRAIAAVRLPAPVVAAFAADRIDGVLHFSRRSADIYLDCAKAAGLLDRAIAPFHYCLSRQVAEPLLAAGAAEIGIASRPDEIALTELIAAP